MGGASVGKGFGGSFGAFGAKGKGKGKIKGAPPANDPYWLKKQEFENREILEGTFTGTIASYNTTRGWGFIIPDDYEGLPEAAKAKLAEAVAAQQAAGKTVAD